MTTPRARFRGMAGSARWTVLPILALAAALPLAAQETTTGYSYFLAVEGNATVLQGDADTSTAAEVNLPLLAGDWLSVPSGSRLGVLLSDGNRLHVDGPAELGLDRLAYSPEVDDRQTQLNLTGGRLHVTVAALWEVDEAPRVDTANATLYLQDAGEYVVTGYDPATTEILVRSGFAEVLTRRGSSVVRAGERLLVEGDDWPLVSVDTAPAPDLFEDWVRRQDDIRLTQSPVTREVLDEPLSYQAADLDEHGQWVVAEGTRVWKPVVELGWRPYWQGRWHYTPSGLYWLSYDPWSPITYHYGSWDYLPAYGWVWYPGRVYAPAHVYWYWGPSYVAWVPWGYYGRHYGHRYSRFSHGLHVGTWGTIGGHWGLYDHWVFCPPRFLGHRRQHHHHDDNRRAHDKLGVPELPRGILADDTRGLTPDTWTKADQVEKTLLRRLRNERGGGSVQVPDATAFVAREDRLPPSLERRIAETPLPAKPAKATPVRSSDPRVPRLTDSGDRRPAGIVVPRRTPSSGAVDDRGKEATPKTAGRPAPQPPERSPATDRTPPPAKPARPSVAPPRDRPANGVTVPAKPDKGGAPAVGSGASGGTGRTVTPARTPVAPVSTPVPPRDLRREPTTTRMKTPTTVERSRASDSARRVLEPIRSRPAPRTPSRVAPTTPRPAPRAVPSTPRPGSRPTGIVPRTVTRPPASRPAAKPRTGTVRSMPRSTPRPTRPSTSSSKPTRSRSGSVSRPASRPSTVKSRPSVPRRSPATRSGGASSRRPSATSSSRAPKSRGKPAAKPRSSSRPKA